jgi:hypothetical protein
MLGHAFSVAMLSLARSLGSSQGDSIARLDAGGVAWREASSRGGFITLFAQRVLTTEAY